MIGAGFWGNMDTASALGQPQTGSCFPTIARSEAQLFRHLGMHVVGPLSYVCYLLHLR